MTDTPKHSVSVAGIVVDEHGRCWPSVGDNAHWEPPGGVLELEETPEDGSSARYSRRPASRRGRGLSGVYKNMSRGIVALVFRCRRVVGGAQND